MARFRYKAISVTGAVLNGELEASSRQSAIDQLRSSGHLPVRADPMPQGRGMLSFAARRPRNRVKPGNVAVFTRELATLLGAGMPLDNALHMLEETGEINAMSDVLHSIRERVQSGHSLSDALSDEPGLFSKLYVNIVRAGEASGALHSIFARLADYTENMSMLRSSVVTALIYPAILLVVSLLSLFMLLGFVVPQFIPLFEGAEATLPLLTRAVFGAASLLRDFWWLWLGLLLLGIVITGKWLAIPSVRRGFDVWQLRVPIFGDLLAKLETARLARTLGTLLDNGVPLLASIPLVHDVMGNRVLAEDITAVSRSLEQGQGLSRPLRERGHLPVLAIQLIEVGEESGQLAEMLNRVADIFDKEVQASLKRLLTLVEPVLILGLGSIIAVIIISVLVAILGLNDLVV